MNKESRLEDDPAWLMLPLTRRQAALQRLDVMLAYETHDRPGELEAQQAARQLGVTTGQFYRIRRQWLRRRSVFDLLPYGMPGAARKPKLDQDVADAVSDLIMKAIRDGVRAPAEILRQIHSGWRLEKPIPSHMTLRKNIADAFDKLTNVSGGLVVVNSSIPQEALETATGYGEVLTIDFIGLQVFVATEGGPVAPIAGFAVDLYTSSIAGVHLSFGAPGPLQFEAVLRDAEARSAQAAPPDTAAVKPRLVFEAGGNSGWSKILSRLERGGFQANVRRSQRLSFGEIAHTLIGNSVGDVRFVTRKLLNDLVFNPGEHALIAFVELKKLIEDGVRNLNEKRIASDIELHPLKFDF